MLRPDRSKLDSLECIRGVLCMCVVATHVAYIPDHELSPALAKLVPLGVLCAPFFFVVSAFGLWYGYARDGRLKGGAWQFYKRRFFRLAPLYYTMLAVYLVWIVRSDVPDAKIIGAVTGTYNLIPGQSSGLVWASWTIGVEVVFYAMLPILALFSGRWMYEVLLFQASILLAIPMVLVIGSMDRSSWASWTQAKTDAYFSVANQMIYLAAGMVAAAAFVKLRGRPPGRVAPLGWFILINSSIGLILLAVRTWTGTDTMALPERVLWAIAIAGFVFGTAVHPPRWLVNRVTTVLGKVSFSMYLIHPIVVWLLDERGVIPWADRTYGAWGYPLAIAVTVAVVFPIALVTYFVIELPGMRLGGVSVIGPASPWRRKADRLPAGPVPASRHLQMPPPTPAMVRTSLDDRLRTPVPAPVN